MKLRLIQDCEHGKRGRVAEVPNGEAKRLCRRGIAYPFTDEGLGRQVPYFVADEPSADVRKAVDDPRLVEAKAPTVDEKKDGRKK